MKCEVCKRQCKEKLTIVESGWNKAHWNVCEECFNLWTNQDYDKLTKRIKK